MIVLSGMWAPPEALPQWMAWPMLASPTSWYVDAGFGLLLKGKVPVDILLPLAAIVAMAVRFSCSACSASAASSAADRARPASV